MVLKLHGTCFVNTDAWIPVDSDTPGLCPLSTVFELFWQIIQELASIIQLSRRGFFWFGQQWTETNKYVFLLNEQPRDFSIAKPYKFLRCSSEVENLTEREMEAKRFSRLQGNSEPEGEIRSLSRECEEVQTELGSGGICDIFLASSATKGNLSLGHTWVQQGVKFWLHIPPSMMLDSSFNFSGLFGL